MYQQMLAAGEYNSAAEYNTLYALALQEYEEEQAYEQVYEEAALEYTMQEEHKYDWLNCRTCVTRAMGNCNLWRSVSDEGCNTHPNCPVKQESLKEVTREEYEKEVAQEDCRIDSLMEGCRKD